MKGKFIVYALIVSFVCTAASWSKLLSGNSMSNFSSGSGSSWSSNSSSGSWGGGGGSHK